MPSPIRFFTDAITKWIYIFLQKKKYSIKSKADRPGDGDGAAVVVHAYDVPAHT